MTNLISQATDPQLPPKERILQTAHDLFYRDGIRATGIDRIIADSSVAKKTFYRYFPSKNDLIEEFLKYRHELWIAWFRDALLRHGKGLESLVPALKEWFSDPIFRGCAFINSVSELGSIAPKVAAITCEHKQDMTELIADLIPQSTDKQMKAAAIALAVDGAIIRVQYEQTAEGAIASLQSVVEQFSKPG